MPLGHPTRILRLHLIINRNIQISPIILVGPAAQLAAHGLPSFHGQDVGEVEDGLLPVGVLGVGSGAEADGLVAGGELDVEPGDQGVDVVGAADGQAEGQAEGQVFGGDFVQVEGQDGAGVGDDGFELDGVDEGLGEGGDFEGRVVEAVDIVPDCCTESVCCSSLSGSNAAHSQSSHPCTRHPQYQP
jgi:hypothetical protein